MTEFHIRQTKAHLSSNRAYATGKRRFVIDGPTGSGMDQSGGRVRPDVFSMVSDDGALPDRCPGLDGDFLAWTGRAIAWSKKSLCGLNNWLGSHA